MVETYMLVTLTVIVAFMLLEIANVLTLYFKPELKYANGVGVFNSWEKSKEDSSMYDFVNYLVKWVAGTKIIFIALLGAIIIWGTLSGNDLIQIIALGVLILTTVVFYFKMYPLIRRMDKRGEITPKNYSTVLAIMILFFLLAFTAAFTYGLIMYLQF